MTLVGMEIMGNAPRKIESARQSNVVQAWHDRSSEPLHTYPCMHSRCNGMGNKEEAEIGGHDREAEAKWNKEITIENH